MSILNKILAAGFVTVAASTAQAAVVSAYSDASGFSATATIEDAGVDQVMVTLEIDTSTGIWGDIRAWYTNSATYVASLIDISGDFEDGDRNTSQAGSGDTNVNPAGPFDIGLEFGTPGMGADDIQSTSFYLVGTGLSEASFFGQDSMLRVTSVGPIGDREGSLKLPGAEVPLPASAFLLLGGLGGLAVMRRRKQKA